MQVQLMYSVDDIRLRHWDFVPCVGDVIWDESIEVTGQIYRVAERHITLNSRGEVAKVTLNLDKNLNP